jgi:regulatory protein
VNPSASRGRGNRGTRRRARAARPEPARQSEDGPQRARQAALTLLARRELSEEQLRRALAAKDLDGGDIAVAIASLRDQRVLDDASLSSRYALSRMKFKGQGQHRIRRGLRQKGLPGAIIEEGIREATAEVSEAEVLERLARRYWTQRSKQDPPRRLRGLWAFLLRRGFPARLVHDRLRALWPRWSDALAGLDPENLESE